MSLKSRFSWSAWVYDTKLVIKTHSFNPWLRIPLRQEILFEISIVFSTSKKNTTCSTIIATNFGNIKSQVEKKIIERKI